ncbi:MAG: hypothetical protein AAGE94_21950 [Acidobacteriota bacterium]
MSSRRTLAVALTVLVSIVWLGTSATVAEETPFADPKVEHGMLSFQSIEHIQSVVAALAAAQESADDAGESRDVFGELAERLGFESMAARARMIEGEPAKHAEESRMASSDAHIADPYLRSLLNPKAEIAVGDTLYWFTPGGLYSIADRDVELLDRLHRGETVAAKTLDFDPWTRRDIEPLPPSCCYANEQITTAEVYGPSLRIVARQWVMSTPIYSSVGAVVVHERNTNGQWAREPARSLALFGGYDVSREGCTDDTIDTVHFSRSGSDIDEVRVVHLALTPDLRVRRHFDTMFAVEHLGADGSAQLSHCLCRGATVSFRPQVAAPMSPSGVRIDGSASTFESRFWVEIAEVNGVGSNTTVGAAPWSRWFHGEVPADFDLSAHYPFLPDRAYRVTLAVQNGCTAWDEQIEWIETHPSDLSVQYRAHVRGDGWLNWVYDGGLAGTVAQNRRMEAVEVELVGQIGGNVELCYEADVRHHGWQSAVCNGAVAGTTYQGLRMERFKIYFRPSLVGAGCHVEYRGHSAGSGWSQWVRDGVSVGVDDKRLEAVEIQLVGCS